MEEENKRLQELRNYLIKEILEKIPKSYLNGDPEKRIPTNANFRFDFIEGESMLLSLKDENLSIATGSACSSKTLEPSHTLISLGLLHEEAHGSLVVSLGRYKERISYVIGAKYPDESVSQVWIEKNTFRPIRYLLRSGGQHDANLEEIEYTDYVPLDKGRSYPERILFFQNGQLARMNVLKTFRVNPDVPDQLFDIAHLKTVYHSISSDEPSPSTESEVDEVKKTIRDFSRTFE